MLVCNCTLPYTNPDACKNCSVYLAYYGDNKFKDNWDDKYKLEKYDPSIFTPKIPSPDEINDFFEKFKKPINISPKKVIKRTIEKYDENGILIGKEIITEEIIEEYEEYPKITYKYFGTTDNTLNNTNNINYNGAENLTN